jgi:hypothetical protein
MAHGGAKIPFEYRPIALIERSVNSSFNYQRLFAMIAREFAIWFCLIPAIKFSPISLAVAP